MNHVIMDFIHYIQEVFVCTILKKPRGKSIFEQLDFIANQSLIIVLICVSFAAMVTILESSFHMKLVIQNDSMVPGFASMLILRELGAVVTALLLTSRVGAGIAAEVGSMKVTEQVDALKMLSIDPVHFLVSPRLIAGIVGTALLTLIANVVCILCSMLVSDLYLGFSSGLFLVSMNRFVGMIDLWLSLVKGACFGAVIPIVSCYFGLRCRAGAEGVGQATTQAVVISSIGIIVIDFILSYLFTGLY